MYEAPCQVLSVYCLTNPLCATGAVSGVLQAQPREQPAPVQTRSGLASSWPRQVWPRAPSLKDSARRLGVLWPQHFQLKRTGQELGSGICSQQSYFLSWDH